MLFDDPNREKFGFYWNDLKPEIIKQTIKYGNRDFSFSGFYIRNYEEAAISMGLFNRYFYLIYIDYFEEWSNNNDLRIRLNYSKEIDKKIWEVFQNNMKNSFNLYYVPFKKFLALKRPEKCWISFSKNKLLPSDPIYSDFLCGIDSIEIGSINSLFFNMEKWVAAIKDGPMGNPEIPIVEKFLYYFPESIPFAPENITKDLDLGYLKKLNDFGLI